MKLSNKILIGFFGFLFVYLTAIFAEVRFRGTPSVIDDTNSLAETVDATGITFIALIDLDESVNIIGSDEPARLEVRSLTGGLLQRITYKISGDTLILSGLQSDVDLNMRINVYVPKDGLRGISVDSAVANVRKLNVSRIHISQNDSRVWMSDNSIDNMVVTALGGSTLEFGGELDTLTTYTEESNLFIGPTIRALRGSITKGSYLQLGAADDIQFRKDESSRLNLYQ